MKLDQFFWWDQPATEFGKVLLKQHKEAVNRERIALRKEKKERIGTKRILTGRRNIEIIYPKSGRVLDGRLQSFGDITIIEPIKEDTAMWFVRTSDVTNHSVDLKEVEFKRFNHSIRGNKLISNVQRGYICAFEDIH